MDNREVAHLWANRSRPSGRGSHFFFEGDTIYSYGKHFPIARHYQGVVLFTAQDYSITTAIHKGHARSACSHLTVFHVDNPTNKPSAKDVKAYKQRVEWACIRAGRARNTATALEVAERLVEEANAFCAYFGFKTRFEVPAIGELREKAKASEKRERKAAAAKKARIERESREMVKDWLAGARGGMPYHIEKVYLRAKNGDMETSKGARVPLDEAKRTFRFVMKMRTAGWKRNGHEFKVGAYHLDAVNDFGVIAGCHRVSWEEIERFASSLGWL